MISTMTGTARDRLNERVDGLGLDTSHVSGLFNLADALATQPALRRALSDPGIEPGARAELAKRLLGGKLDEKVLAVLAAAAEQAWPDDLEFASAMLDQAARASLRGSPSPDEVGGELFAFGQLVQANAKLAQTLRDQRIPLSERRGLVAKLLANRARPETVELAQHAVVDGAGRTSDVSAMVRHFLEVGANAHGKTLARVTTAKALSDQQRTELQRQLERIYQSKIFLVSDVDPEVLGGVRVEIGDEVIDGTVKARVDQVQQELRIGN